VSSSKLCHTCFQSVVLAAGHTRQMDCLIAKSYWLRGTSFSITRSRSSLSVGLYSVTKQSCGLSSRGLRIQVQERPIYLSTYSKCVSGVLKPEPKSLMTSSPEDTRSSGGDYADSDVEMMRKIVRARDPSMVMLMRALSRTVSWSPFRARPLKLLMLSRSWRKNCGQHMFR
jgi:hypothetical protein